MNKYHKITPDIHGKTTPMPGMGAPEAKDQIPIVPFGGGKALKWIRDMRREPCHYCGNQAQTIDHKIPRSKGGKTVRTNCVPSCLPCNQRKADMGYEEFLKLT